MRRFPLLVTIVGLLPFLTQARDVNYQGDLAPLNILPTFDRGYLAVYEPEETIALYGPDGSLAYRAIAQVPGEPVHSINNATPDADGTLAIAIEHRVDKSPGGGIAVFDPTGIQSAFIDTGTDWLPTQVCFGPDHSIWTIGWRGLNPPATSSAEYFVLRNYTRDGRLVGAFLPRSSFEQDPVGPIIGGWQIRSANGRIGALFYATSVLPFGAERRTPEWIETDLRGNIVRRVNMPQRTIRAFSGDGSLYALGYHGGYTVLDPTVNSWRIVPGATEGNLLGGDGSSLVFQIRGANRVVWSPLE
jgi:hypothetical protein